MYRTQKEYLEITNMITDIYCDYNICHFPISEKEVADKMGIELIPYSRFPIADREILMKTSDQGFFLRHNQGRKNLIFYNDEYRSLGAIRFTIFRELKHYVSYDCNDNEDDKAEFFARYIMCPIPYLILRGIKTEDDIIKFCGTSREVAKNVEKNISHRTEKYGDAIFDYEVRLLEQIDPLLPGTIKNLIICSQ